MSRSPNSTMGMIIEIAVLAVLLQAIRHPVSDWERAIRAIARQPVTPALAPAPEPVKPVRARRTRAKVAA